MFVKRPESISSSNKIFGLELDKAQPRNLRVFHLARLECNPYLNLLLRSLKAKNIHIDGGEYNSQSIFFLWQVLSATKPDIFHIHDIHYFLQGKQQGKFDNIIRRQLKFIIFITQIVILKIIGIKIIWTVHEWTDKYANGKQNILPIWGFILGQIIDAIITHCHSTQNAVEKVFHIGRSNKITTIYHGNYLDAYPNKVSSEFARHSLGISQDKLVFLLFGNIFPSKGFVKAIEEFQKLDGDNLKIFLLVVGKPVNQAIQDLITCKIEHSANIKFIPKQIPDEEIQIYMNACNCVILPYQIFTTSGVAILAMTFAKVCIAPNIGYFSEIFDDDGAFLFDGDTNSLLTAMQQSIKQQNYLTAMGKHNFRKVQQWSWDSVANATVNIYKSCIK
jgi:beta-1,4-mannosyltransferase